MDSKKTPYTSCKVYQKEVKPMLEMVDDLADILEGHTPCMALPSIAVVGNQSSGKSTVLSRISGISLPQASGLCTRAPLRLSMRNKPDPSVSIKYQGMKKMKEVERSSLAQEIKSATSKLAGESQKISKHSIKVQCEGPHLPDLTVIDLPGIVYSPKGDQPHDIKDQVRELILSYIRDESTLILCVFAGNTDLEASEALSIAREVDPNGERTLGVITKLDLVQAHEISMLPKKILQQGNENLRVKLGLVAVCNLLEATKSHVEIEQADAKEQQRIDRMTELRQVPQGSLGAPALVQRLCGLQLDHLRAVLPQIGKQLQDCIGESQKRLAALKGCSTEEESFLQVQKYVTELGMALRCMSCGNYEAMDFMAPGDRLRPRVQSILEDFRQELGKRAPKVFSNEYSSEAERALKETAGLTLSNLLSHETVNSLIRKWQKPYQELAREAVQHAAHEVKLVLLALTKNIVASQVQEFFCHRLKETLKSQQQQASQHMDLVLRMESAVIDTLNNYYDLTLTKLQKMGETVSHSAENTHFDRELLELVREGCASDKELETTLQRIVKLNKSHDAGHHRLLVLQLSVFCYDKVARKRLADTVLQTVRFFFVEHVAYELIGKIASGLTPEQAHSLLASSEAEAEERRRLLARLDACRKGLERISMTAGCFPASASSSADLDEYSAPSWIRESKKGGEEDKQKLTPSAGESRGEEEVPPPKKRVRRR